MRYRALTQQEKYENTKKLFDKKSKNEQARDRELARFRNCGGDRTRTCKPLRVLVFETSGLPLAVLLPCGPDGT